VSVLVHPARFAVAGLCAVAIASCGSSSKTTSTATGTTGKNPTQPVFAQSVVLQRVSGTVRVKLPSSAAFVRLQGVPRVQLGTVIDARGGLVRLTAASPTAGKLAVGDFHEGEFRVLQSGANNGAVELSLQDTKSERTTCTGVNGSRKQTTSLLGVLLGSGQGHFQTRGEFAAASVEGTDWGVRNRCDGTLTVVRKGTVLVTDFRLHKNVTVHAGQTYLARAA
jgi:hypothetical protein